MPRRSSPPKREVVPDVKYHNTRVTMFINRMMHGGKKSTALRALYGAFDLIEERSKRDPLEVLSRRCATRRRFSKSSRAAWVARPTRSRSKSARIARSRWRCAGCWPRRAGRGGRSMSEKLAAEFMDAATGQGSAIKKKEDTHRMAEANRAFAHYRW